MKRAIDFVYQIVMSNQWVTFWGVLALSYTIVAMFMCKPWHAILLALIAMRLFSLIRPVS
jgi:hypothetical protein